jgi:hypothetical protein
MKSIAISLHPLASALSKAQKLTKGWLGKSQYKPKNSKQKVLFKYYDQLVADLDKITEMKSIVHTDPSVVEDFIESGKGRLSKISKTDIEFTVGSVFEILLKWVKPGEKTTMKFEGKTVMSSVMKDVLHFKGVLCLHAKNGDLVFMKVGQVKNSLELFETVLGLLQVVKKDPERVEAHFPFVKLRTEEDYKWLKGLDLDPDAKHSHPGYTVTDAKAKNELDIDNEGARIKSSAQVTHLTKGISVKPKIVKIDEPFLFWVMRPGCELPVFAAFVNSDVLIKK